MKEKQMPQAPIQKVKQTPFDKAAFLKAAEKVKKIIEKEKASSANA